MRSAVNQANSTFGTATGAAGTAGGAAAGINGQLTPFLQQRLNDPQGYSQQDMGAMLASALGSSGGSTSGITGQADLQAGRTRNAAGLTSALDDAARQRTKANASAAEGIASQDAGVKLDQQNSAAKMLQGLYGTDISAQNSDLNTADQATSTAVDASKSGWLQNAMGILNTLSGGATAASAVKKAF